MAKRGPKNTRHVVPHDDGWAVRAPGSERASSVHHTQREAERRAKEIVGNQGGGEVRIHGRGGQIRDSDTVAPGNDPNPPRQLARPLVEPLRPYTRVGDIPGIDAGFDPL